MRRNPWTAFAAIVIAAVLLALLIPVAGVTAPGASAAPARSTASQLTPSVLERPLTGSLKVYALKQASAAATAAGLSASQKSQLLTEVGGMSPDQIAAADGISPAVLTADLNPWQSATLCATSPLGCVVGYLSGSLSFQYADNQAKNQIYGQYANWSNAMVTSAWDEANITAAGTSNLLSALNFSLPGFERMAENAAMSQVGNTSFNLLQDEYQSGLAAQFASIYGSYTTQEEAIAAGLLGWFVAQTGTNAEFGSLTPDMNWGGFGSSGVAGPGYGFPNPPAWAPSSFEPWPAIIQPAEIYLPPGSSFVWVQNVMTTSATWTLTNQFNPAITVSSSNTQTGGNGWVNITLPASFQSGGVFNVGVAGVGKFYQLTAPGVAEVPTSSAQSVGGVPNVNYGYGYGVAGAYDSGVVDGYTGGAISSGNPGNLDVLDSGTVVSLGTGNSAYTAATHTASLSAGPIGTNYPTWLGALEYKAAVSGEVYWSFLRAIGYTSPSQIAPDCIIPMPYQVLPSDLNLGSLTQTELQTLYLSWLQGLGNFYNVTLSATNFCGTQSQHQFHLGDAIWGNLLVNATGDVYLNNGTSPIALNGTALGSELYGNLSTWALTHEQLLLMPTLGTVHIPVGIKWQVPAGNPIEVYAVQAGQMFTARGNGSSSGAATVVPFATALPGDSIYLTSCIVGGVVTTNCTVTVQTVNTTSGNISCGLNTSGLGSCHTVTIGGGGATFGGLPNPFTWLSGLLSGLFGGGALGSFLGSLVAGLAMLVAIAVLVYVAVIEVEAWGNRKRGGGAGGGGSTVVVTGGR